MHLFPASVIVPREAGLLHFGVRSTYILGLQIGLNFVPVYRVVAFGEGGQRIGNKIEFFCLLNCTLTAGSLTSTYRVVRKYNFKS